MDGIGSTGYKLSCLQSQPTSLLATVNKFDLY